MRRGSSESQIPSLQFARQLATDALLFLAQDDARIVQFLNACGMDPADLRASARDDRTLAAVLDHLMAHESLLLVFAANARHQPADIQPALDRLRRCGEYGDTA
jgi:Protein of unknown function (DUF3572)